MNHVSRIAIVACLLSGGSLPGQTALTIYNQDFAVVRETVPLDLKPGENQVRFEGATAYVEPGSVVLRDASGAHAFQILEQNYRGDPISESALLELNVGKTIEFEIVNQTGAITRQSVRGKIVRSGYGPWQNQGGGYSAAENPGIQQPIIEVNGRLQFTLPGRPLFPALADDAILKPTLVWQIGSDQAAKFDAELSYVSGGLNWLADYNLVMPEQGDAMEVVGWVTMDNKSGTAFKQARIKLMAGDVNKIQNVREYDIRMAYAVGGMGGAGGGPPVTEKTFDEYHLYTLRGPPRCSTARRSRWNSFAPRA